MAGDDDVLADQLRHERHQLARGLIVAPALLALAGVGAVLGLCSPGATTAAPPALPQASPAHVPGEFYPEGEAVPRSLTEAERRFVESNPLRALRGASPPPTGPVWCPPEYAPVDGILIAWEGTSAWTNILRSMAPHITTTGAAKLYVVVDSAGEQSTVSSSLSSAGTNMSRVEFLVRTTDTIWIRDYGPRYIYEGDCRAVVDHTYNRPRPNDDTQPVHFASVKGHARYEIPLVHGGGNYHLDGLNRSRATRLINNENPGLTESQIIGLWNSYQNLDTTLYQPFPTSVDSTQHIDMWMQVIDDNAVVISDWPSNPGSIQDNICDSTAVSMAAEGYTVHRVPARSVGGVHYTYTNVVMCNDIVMIPTYTNPTVAPHNAAAIATWEAALPNKTIIQIPCQNIIGAAGAIHCIVMHIPEHRGGENPTAYLKNHNGGEILAPGEQSEITWITDDDNAVTSVELRLSTDGGATFPTLIASGQDRLGSYTWTAPMGVNTSHARIRVIASDAGGNTGFDDSDASFTIGSGCPADLDGDGAVGSGDLAIILGSWNAGPGPADLDGDGQVGSADLALVLGQWGTCSAAYDCPADLTGDDQALTRDHPQQPACRAGKVRDDRGGKPFHAGSASGNRPRPVAPSPRPLRRRHMLPCANQLVFRCRRQGDQHERL